MTEPKAASQPAKQAYLAGLTQWIKRRETVCTAERDAFAKQIFTQAKSYRQAFRKMLGYPLSDFETTALPMVKVQTIGEENGYTISRMQFEILDGVWMSGLLYQKGNARLPLVIVQHGGEGTPELIAGLYGSTANYNEMLTRVLAQGVHVFAPQLLLWNPECYEVPYDRVELDAKLKRVGSSITAVEVFGITRIMDWLEAQPYVKNFGMVGLSYGGFYTLFTAAADERILSALSCAYFNDSLQNGWADWSWDNAAKTFGNAEIACLVYPRRLCLEVAKSDPLFAYKTAEQEWHRLLSLTESVGQDWLSFVGFAGEHEFCKDDAPLKRLVQDLLQA